MKVAGLQLDIAWEDPPRNFERTEIWLERAAAAGVRLFVLPELFATGFSLAADKVAGHADATRDFLRAAAKRHGLWIMAGFAEPFEPRPRNACGLFDPDGRERLLYHKLHPFSLMGEDQVFSAGTELPSAEVEGVRVTPLICYDLRFPEPFRVAASATDLFVVVANWPDRRSRAAVSVLALTARRVRRSQLPDFRALRWWREAVLGIPGSAPRSRRANRVAASCELRARARSRGGWDLQLLRQE